MDYEADGTTLRYRRRLTFGPEILIEADAIRRERTGVHAKVSILASTVVLAWGVVNVEKDEERVRLTNSAYRQLTASMNGTAKQLGDEYPNGYLKHEVDTFCRGLWDQHLARVLPVMDGGLEPSLPEWWLEPYIVKDAGTILFAPPGAGKSFTMMLWAVSMDAGKSTSVWQTTQTPVLMVNLERPRDSVRRRLGAVNACLGLPRHREIAILHARGQSLADVYDGAKHWIREHQSGCVLVDSISRAGAGDLNENQAGNRIVDLLNGFGCSWVGLAHTPRADTSHTYGSVMFDAGADIIVKIKSEQEENGALGIGLFMEKANDLPKFPPMIYALDFTTSGLQEIRRPRKSEFPDLEAGKMTLEQEVIGFLLEEGKATATEVSEALKRSRTYIVDILRSNRFERVGREKGRLGVLYAVKARVSE